MPGLRLIIAEAEDWPLHAACRGVTDGDRIFYERSRESEAKAICKRCPVKTECLEDALTYPHRNDHGVLGGLSRGERHEIRCRREGAGADRTFRHDARY